MPMQLKGIAATLVRDLGLCSGLTYAVKYAERLGDSSDRVHQSMANNYACAATELTQFRSTSLAEALSAIHAASSTAELATAQTAARSVFRGFPDDIFAIDEAVSVRLDQLVISRAGGAK